MVRLVLFQDEEKLILRFLEIVIPRLNYLSTPHLLTANAVCRRSTQGNSHYHLSSKHNYKMVTLPAVVTDIICLGD